MTHLTQMLLALSSLAAATAANALVIDFGTGPDVPDICTSASDGSGSLVACGNYGYISQSYGDVAGLVDVSYSAPRQPSPNTLYWWVSNYNNLYGVAFAPSNDADSQARIEIKALQPDSAVTLSSFMLGAYPSSTLNTTVNVTTIGGGTTLFSYSGPVGTGSVSATTFTPNVSASGGLWITFQDSAWNVGIDNINYTVTAIPEPATVAMLLAGLAGLALRARCRG
jgi:hypothetical protein